MTSNLSIIIGGTPATMLGWWGEPIVTWRFPLGSWELSWRMHIPRSGHPALTRGRLVQAKLGPLPIWRGHISEVDRAEGSCIALGTARQAETALALDFAGNSTTSVGTAVGAAALNRGAFSVGTLHDFGPPLTTDTPDAVNTLAGLLDAYTSTHGTNWVVDAEGILHIRDDPTTPIYRITPGTAAPGIADEDYWTTLAGRYMTASGGYATVFSTDNSQGAGVRERTVDLAPRGPLSAAEAQAILNAIHAKGLARTGWTEPVNLAAGQVFTMGGTPVALWMVGQRISSGVMVRLDGVRDERGASLRTDVIIEEAIWNVPEGTMQLKPRGLAARDLASIVEAAGGQLL